MKKNNEIITNDIDKFPEFENIRNAILEAREKVATTVNFALGAKRQQFRYPAFATERSEAKGKYLKRQGTDVP